MCTVLYSTRIIGLWYAGFNHKLLQNPSSSRKGIVRSLTTSIWAGSDYPAHKNLYYVTTILWLLWEIQIRHTLHWGLNISVLAAVRWPGVSPRTGEEAQENRSWLEQLRAVARMKGDHSGTVWITFLLSKLSTYTVIRSSNKILNMIPLRSKEDPETTEARVIIEPGAWSHKL